MARKSIRLNYIYNVGYQLSLLLIPLVTTPYISRVLGADGIGTYSFAGSIVSYFTLFAAMGTAVYGQREISYLQDDRKRRSQVFWETETLSLISTAVCLSAYLAFSFWQREEGIYLCLSFNVMAVAADITWFFQGMEEFGRIALRNFAFKALNVLFIFVFVRSKDDLVIYILGSSVLLFLNNLSLWPYLPRFVDKPAWREIRPLRNLKVVFSLFVPTIAIHLYTVLDKTMIGLFTSSSFENGYYEQALKMAKMTLTVVTSFVAVMIPRIGFHVEKEEGETVRQLMYRSYTFVWFLGVPLCFGLVGVSDNFVHWFFGSGFDKVSILLRILAFLILAIGISNVTGLQYLVPTKRQNMLTATVLAGAAVNLALNLLLIPRWYSVGAAVASVAAETTITLVQLCLVRKEISVRKVFGCGAHYLAAGGIMAAVLLLEGRYLTSSAVNTCLMTASGAGVYFAVLWAMGDEFFLENVRRLWRRGGGKKRG